MKRRELAYLAIKTIAVVLAVSMAATVLDPEAAMIDWHAKKEQVDQTARDHEYVRQLAAKHDEEIAMLAKVVYREARGVGSTTEQAAVIWCILNRVDSKRYPDTIEEVITRRYQFAWRARTPVTVNLKALATDVFIRWQLEKLGYADVGRVLPKEYLFFAASNGKNRFRKEYRSRKHWNWTLPTPYED